MSDTTQRKLAGPLNLMRITGIIEGVSYLVLLFVAMPLKYFADMPMAVRLTGSVHGLLFILFFCSIAHAMMKASLRFKHASWAALASLLPFATFFLDKSIFDQYRNH